MSLKSLHVWISQNLSGAKRSSCVVFYLGKAQLLVLRQHSTAFASFVKLLKEFCQNMSIFLYFRSTYLLILELLTSHGLHLGIMEL